MQYYDVQHGEQTLVSSAPLFRFREPLDMTMSYFVGSELYITLFLLHPSPRPPQAWIVDFPWWCMSCLVLEKRSQSVINCMQIFVYSNVNLHSERVAGLLPFILLV